MRLFKKKKVKQTKYAYNACIRNTNKSFPFILLLIAAYKKIPQHKYKQTFTTQVYNKINYIIILNEKKKRG